MDNLLRILGKLVDDKGYSDSELENMNWEEKFRMTQSDPVTCARYFDYQFDQFLKHILKRMLLLKGKLQTGFTEESISREAHLTFIC